MKARMLSRTSARRGLRMLAVAGVALMVLGACSHLMRMAGGRDVPRPAAEEFGFGPRSSAAGLYHATIEPAQPIRVGRMHAWTLRVDNGGGAAVEDARITVDGGMPQHGHGLPTKPRVTRSLGGGAYQVDGMKFNMGGWWEVRFLIAGPAGTDSVTFNLDL